MKKQFVICGSIGWCLEILWTGLHSFFEGNLTMTGRTSLLMFPIYGCAAMIGPMSKKLISIPLCIRGLFYTVGIFFTEFSTGLFLKHLHICPWDYSHTPFHYKGVIRLDYIPVWFFVIIGNAGVGNKKHLIS